MPRWRALPEELDPQVREFAEQLRRIVERSGLGIGAVADRTGYSKTSWERYLNGRLLPPRGAAEALAEATGIDVGHLGTLWELAERAWSRSELRHDVTMEAVRVAEAKAALGVATAPAPTSLEKRAAVALGAEGVDEASVLPPPSRPEAPPPPPASARDDGVDVRAKAIPMDAGHRRRPPRRAGRGRHTALLFTAGAVGTLLVAVAAVLLLGSGPVGAKRPTPLAALPSAGNPAAALPTGVGCTGAGCTGKDPETMGCGGQHATTAGSATVGTSYLEVRYSGTCKAAWARMTQGAPGDALRVSAATGSGAGRVERGADGHSTMVAVSAPGEATACAVLSSGEQGCTVPRMP
ncbi:XRE family transcriptional regulator [Streptomyces sp. AV19]|uniref:helix-turn-helix domain-containing protein n=1 Tax=Streptomyces sp. AV19 TaxID=2793068 RepID=UPI0018FE6611|nr:XRE family transcriptional regulator [Streptomyces sp. AV19]MBH1935958.1 XRE family transcriptional regulator [Streptomyces sp. AV19]MDG4534251.1 XRE family transcriptional regulator [Streptomyces sp. AV19]